MNTKVLVILAVLVVVGVAGWTIIRPNPTPSPEPTSTPADQEQSETQPQGDTELMESLMTSATVEFEETGGPVTLTGKTTEFGDFENDKTSPYGTITFGNIAMPYYYYSDTDKGSDAVTTLAVNSGGSGEFFYLAAFTPGEASWQMADSVALGDRIKVTDLKVVGETITIVYMEHGPEQAMVEAPNVQVVREFTLVDGDFVESE